MKKVILLASILLIAFTSSCSGDDAPDEEQQVQVQIIGSWKLFRVIKDGSEVVATECRKESNYVITPNGAFTCLYKYENNGCFVGKNVAGTWADLGNNTYRFTAPNEVWEEHIEFVGDTMELIVDDSKDIFKKIN